MRGVFGLCLCITLFYGCSGLERSEQEKIRKANTKEEVILRLEGEIFCKIENPKQRVREPYSWEPQLVGGYPKITKEYFRCRGHAKNPPRIASIGTMQTSLYDCGGYDKHSLPIKGDKEFIYSILIDLLNYVQKMTEKKVIITCGHRCPAHEAYANASKQYQLSKHLIGAEVDFYVKGMEFSPEKVVQILTQYYKDCSESDYKTFSCFRGEEERHNKEVVLRIYRKDEGRDLDNEHSYPYVSIQVKYDKESDKKVVCQLNEATRCYLRW